MSKDIKPEHLELVLHGAEERHLEYKASLDFSTQTTKAMLTRAIAAHANTRDGGVIIVGMEKSAQSYKRTGLTPSHLASLNVDELRDFVRSHLTPTPNFAVELEKFEDKAYAVLSVSPFTRYPSVCTTSYRDENGRKYVLVTGAFYVRSRRKPESVAVETLEDLEDLIDMATDQWLQYRARREVSSGVSTKEVARRRFDAEGADL